MIQMMLVRHGQTDGNIQGRYQGRTDVDLNQVGREQANKLAQRLSSEKIGYIYSSSLKRAMQTAEAVAKLHGMTVIPREDIREIDVGDLEGMTVEEIERKYGSQRELWENNSWCPPGGESLVQLNHRVGKFIEDIRQRHDENTILVVAHGGTLRSLLSNCLEFGTHTWPRISIDSASLSIITLNEDRAMLSLLNDTCHLQDSKGYI
ncbi:MAG: histidine phosphatase family protein [Chloroflexota bacterium]|nr:histidine phosphatase family protein [Chloroflexota bacterium]